MARTGRNSHWIKTHPHRVYNENEVNESKYELIINHNHMSDVFNIFDLLRVLKSKGAGCLEQNLVASTENCTENYDI